jgi:hypothetical protein
VQSPDQLEPRHAARHVDVGQDYRDHLFLDRANRVISTFRNHNAVAGATENPGHQRPDSRLVIDHEHARVARDMVDRL